MGLSLDERRAILHTEINGYLSKGFRVQSQTDTTAQLIKPKKFSLFWGILWFFCFGVGLLLYIVYYLSKQDETIYLEIDEDGSVKRNGKGGLVGGRMRLFGLSSTGTIIICALCLVLVLVNGLNNKSGNNTSTPPQTAIAQVSSVSDTPTSPHATSNSIITQAATLCVTCNLECPRHQGQIDLCLVDPKLLKNQKLLEDTLRTYCDYKSSDFCQIMVWADQNYLPESLLTITEEQSNNQVAQYNRNTNTGFDCYKQWSGGKQIYASNGC